MESVLASMGLLAGVHFAAMLSPGPTALMVLRHGARGGGASLLPLVSGIVAATTTNVALTLAGVAAIIAASPDLAMALALAGAAYLVHLGAKALWTAHGKLSRSAPRRDAGPIPERATRAPTAPALFRDGYLINLLNPKIAVFYVSIFSQVAAPGLPRATLALFSGQMIVQSLVFWSAFALLTRAGIVGRAVDRSNGWIDLLFGGALVCFAVYLVAGRL